MHGNAPAETAAGQASPSESGVDFRPVPALEDSAGAWLCAACHNRVATERDRFQVGGTQDHFLFQNPEGLVFWIVTFARTLGCRETGAPTLEHTWFPGHAWSFCRCGQCRLHLGWYYAGLQHFAGLIHARLVYAASVSN